MSNNDTFQWTDELVAQCFEYIREDTAGVLTPVGVRKNVEYFKASHTQQEPKRDWEIVAYDLHGRIFNLVDGLENLFKEHGHFDSMGRLELELNTFSKIHSVRRLSDDTVWTVGEHHGGFSYEDRIIEGFEIINNDIVVVQPRGNTAFKDLKKLPPKPQVLFTTEDGVEIFDKQAEIWAIDKKAFNRVTGNGNSIGAWLNGWYTTDKIQNPKEKDKRVLNEMFNRVKIFSTKEKADEWILMNIPCISVSDILALWAFIREEPKRVLIDIVKEKQPTI